jgi:hypothetical protein
MVVQRITFQVRPDGEEKVVELLKQARTAGENPDRMRIYTPSIAPLNAIVAEFEFENLAELDEFWTEWFAAPATAAFLEAWNALMGGGGSNEVWTLVE